MFATPPSRRAATISDLPVTNEEADTFVLPAYAQGGCMGQSATFFATPEPRTTETSIRDKEIQQGHEFGGVKPKSGLPGSSIEREFVAKDRGIKTEAGAAPTDNEKRGIDQLYATIM